MTQSHCGFEWTASRLPTIDEPASRHALSACDAAFRELALRRRMPMATRDKALSAAMRIAGVAAYPTV